jgi:hypothetical protein
VKWKLKAFVQNVIARLPRELLMWTYYRLQRHFGGLRHVDPSSRLVAGVETWERIRRQGCSPVGKVFLEVGTGWVPLVPLAYWLMGAERTVTIDVNKYLREELVAEHLRKIVEKKVTSRGFLAGGLTLSGLGCYSSLRLSLRSRSRISFRCVKLFTSRRAMPRRWICLLVSLTFIRRTRSLNTLRLRFCGTFLLKEIGYCVTGGCLFIA